MHAVAGWWNRWCLRRWGAHLRQATFTRLCAVAPKPSEHLISHLVDCLCWANVGVQAVSLTCLGPCCKLMPHAVTMLWRCAQVC